MTGLLSMFTLKHYLDAWFELRPLFIFLRYHQTFAENKLSLSFIKHMNAELFYYLDYLNSNSERKESRKMVNFICG